MYVQDVDGVDGGGVVDKTVCNLSFLFLFSNKFVKINGI